jgi:polyhydroxyalkanoate synthase subunit PhaC
MPGKLKSLTCARRGSTVNEPRKPVKNKPISIATAPAFTMVEDALKTLTSGAGDLVKTLTCVSLPPDALMKLQTDYVTQATALWNQSLQNGGMAAYVPVAIPDRRFAAPEWANNPVAAFTAQMYLLNSRTLTQMAQQLQADDKTRSRIQFAVEQWVAMASPSNCLALNPEAIAKAVETQGVSLSQGLQHLLNDTQQGHISQTDESQFEVGRNVATTEGSIVFENALFQLIEYKPLTAKVFERPMLFIPPCINKFYILDLQPENSLIRHTVAQGHRTFVLSWRNADESVAQCTWDDYIQEAAIKAISVVQDITGTKTMNTLGFCVGGTILSTALAVLAARGQHPAASVTLLTTLLDFSNTGVLDLFIDEAMVKQREDALGPHSPKGGNLLKGQELATTFSFLRPNDLVWNYVVGNYLKGETPPAFDLLYWNSDGTNLPGPMYCWYLRNTYLENKLCQPGALEVCGERVDLGAITAPAYIYASREDHIVPWEGAYRNVNLLKGKRRFVLGASGHIAGVINPPAKKKRSHWIGGAALPDDAATWFNKATEHPGSWWTDWSAWLAGHAGKQINAPKGPGNKTHKVIEAAPGRYVKAKAV